MENSNIKESRPNRPANQAKGKGNVNNKELGLMKKELQALKSAFKEQTKSAKIAVMSYDANEEYKRAVDSATSVRSKGKLRYLEKLVGEKFMKSEVPDFSGLSNAHKIAYCASVYSDDLTASVLGGGSPAGVLANLAAEYGPSLLSWLYSKAKAKMFNYKPKGSGAGSLQYPNAEMDFSMTNIHGGSRLLMGIKDCNSVCNEYLASLFCPEEYSSLCPDQFGPSLCLSSQTSSILLNTDSTGNSLAYILPDQVTAAGSVASWFGAQNVLGTAANTTTGVITTPTYAFGLYNPSTAGNVQAYRVTAGSTRIVFNLSATNNSGSCMLAYTTNPPNVAQLGVQSPAITQAQALQFPWCHVAAINGTVELRQIHIPHNITDMELSEFGLTLTECLAQGDALDEIAINVIGGPINTVVARVYTTAQIDYSPGTNIITLNRTKPTPEGAGTLPAASALLKRMPHLAQLTLAEAREFASFILNAPSNYADLVTACLEHGTKYTARPREFVMGGGGQPHIGDMSFEISE